MKKLIVSLLSLALISGAAFAQSLASPDASIIGADSARQGLREVSIDRMEREGSWNVHISADCGIITGRLFDGSPLAKEPLDDADGQEVEDSKVFGAKVEFYRRGVNSFYITCARPIPIEGITKTISLWVCGRNIAHDLWLLVQDYNGNDFELYVGNLEFAGWKKMTVAIPPSTDGVHGIIQQSIYWGDRPGLRVRGFRVDCSPIDAQGSYYIYIDDIRAVTDLYDMENRSEDDMMDDW